MPKMHIERSVSVTAPLDKVFNTLNDLNQWRAWSPWLIMEPEALVKVSEDSKFHSWEGKRIGTGEITVVKEEEGRSIDYDLVFLKPWKSKAKVRFEFTEKGKEVEVKWLMDSSLPFFMFWMKKTMEGLVGMDYDRGLAMLKEYIERGEVSSNLDIKGEASVDAISYVGASVRCTADEVGETMEKCLTELSQWAGENAEIAGVPFTIYHKWDIAKGIVEYTSAVPVKSAPESIPSGYKTGEIPALKTFCVTHTGAYHHLGNAWSTGMNIKQNKGFKQHKKHHPFELYLSDPANTAEKDLVTEVHFPVK